jgi:hypothetical protein
MVCFSSALYVYIHVQKETVLTHRHAYSRSASHTCAREHRADNNKNEKKTS